MLLMVWLRIQIVGMNVMIKEILALSLMIIVIQFSFVCN